MFETAEEQARARGYQDGYAAGRAATVGMTPEDARRRLGGDRAGLPLGPNMEADLGLMSDYLEYVYLTAWRDGLDDAVVGTAAAVLEDEDG